MPEFTAATIPHIVATHNLNPAAAAWSARRVLAALGHPGYGEGFARGALARMEFYGVSAHAATMGGPELARARFERFGR